MRVKDLLLRVNEYNLEDTVDQIEEITGLENDYIYDTVSNYISDRDNQREELQDRLLEEYVEMLVD
mgnify:CR=1 FL=1